MKPYPNYKGHKLRDINPTAIALVTEGANRKKFFLSKLKQEGVSFMKKETALALVKTGELTDSQFALVVADVDAADKVEVQKAYDATKAPSNANIDMEKLAVAIADKIVKAQEAGLKEISDSLKSTITTLEKIAGKPQTNEDPELTDAEAKALIEAEAGKDE